MMKRPLTACLFLLALGLGAPLVTGCSHAGSTAKVASIPSSSMPRGASWDGVYFNPVFGYLHLVENHGTLKGRWSRPQKNRWGELEGEVDDGVVRFQWQEYLTDGFGPNAKKKGKGYFRYLRPSGDNVDDVIEGEIGFGQDEVGTPWRGVRQRNVDPDLDSVMPGASPQTDSDDWDGGGGKKAPKAAPKSTKASTDSTASAESEAADGASEGGASEEPEPAPPPKAKGKGKGKR